MEHKVVAVGRRPLLKAKLAHLLGGVVKVTWQHPRQFAQENPPPNLAVLDILELFPDSDVPPTLRLPAECSRVLVICLRTDWDAFFAALREGIQPSVLEDTPVEILAQLLGLTTQISYLYERAPFVCGEMVRRFLARSQVWDRLTPREGDALELVGQGLSNREIADVLSRREQTVKNLLTVVLHKLGVSNRYEAIALVASNPRPGSWRADLPS